MPQESSHFDNRPEERLPVKRLLRRLTGMRLFECHVCWDTLQKHLSELRKPAEEEQTNVLAHRQRE